MELPSNEENKTCELSDGLERRIRLKNQVLREIVSSEEAYISQLDLLLNVRFKKYFNNIDLYNNIVVSLYSRDS